MAMQGDRQLKTVDVEEERDTGFNGMDTNSFQEYLMEHL